MIRHNCECDLLHDCLLNIKYMYCISVHIHTLIQLTGYLGQV